MFLKNYAKLYHLCFFVTRFRAMSAEPFWTVQPWNNFLHLISSEPFWTVLNRSVSPPHKPSGLNRSEPFCADLMFFRLFRAEPFRTVLHWLCYYHFGLIIEVVAAVQDLNMMCCGWCFGKGPFTSICVLFDKELFCWTSYVKSWIYHFLCMIHGKALFWQCRWT